MNFSYELFPPKTEKGYISLLAKLEQFKKHSIDFVSVTCGAGGGGNINNVQLCSTINREFGLDCIPHVTGIGRTKPEIEAILNQYSAFNPSAYLVLRGDRVKDEPNVGDFEFATDLTSFIRSLNPNQRIVVAGYPEGHQQANDPDLDFQHQLNKAVMLNADIVTQLFFDNESFLKYTDKLRANSYRGKIRAGIFPITDYTQIKRISELSNAFLPPRLLDALEKYKDDPIALEAFGTDYAIAQIDDLYQNNQQHFHLYTMNRSSHILNIRDSLQTSYPK